MKGCSIKLVVGGRDVDTFVATKTGLVTAQRAAARIAQGPGEGAARVDQVCGGERTTLSKCTPKGCTSGLAGVRRSRRAKVLRADGRPEWVVYLTDRKDPLRWDSKGIMSLSSTEMLLIFPVGFTPPLDRARTLVWTGRANTATDGLDVARRRSK